MQQSPGKKRQNDKYLRRNAGFGNGALTAIQQTDIMQI
jgi:hypothetical protein